MTDPLSVAAEIAGLISLSIRVTEFLVDFYTSYKGQDIDIGRTIERLKSLLDTFRFLQDALQHRTFRPDKQGLIRKVESYIKKCDEVIQELQDEYEKCVKTPATGIKGIIRTAGRRAVYPFRESTLKKFDESISEIRENLSLALNIL